MYSILRIYGVFIWAAVMFHGFTWLNGVDLWGMFENILLIGLSWFLVWWMLFPVAAVLASILLIRYRMLSLLGLLTIREVVSSLLGESCRDEIRVDSDFAFQYDEVSWKWLIFTLNAFAELDVIKFCGCSRQYNVTKSLLLLFASYVCWWKALQWFWLAEVVGSFDSEIIWVQRTVCYDRWKWKAAKQVFLKMYVVDAVTKLVDQKRSGPMESFTKVFEFCQTCIFGSRRGLTVIVNYASAI